jgi:hypothetical protein
MITKPLMCICFVISFAATDLYLQVTEICKIETSEYKIYLYHTEVRLSTLYVLCRFIHYGINFHTTSLPF